MFGVRELRTKIYKLCILYNKANINCLLIFFIGKCMPSHQVLRKTRRRKTAQDAIENPELKSKYAMNLTDKFDMIRMSLQAVIQGFTNSRIILGSSGVGKTKTVIDELSNEKINFVHISGGVKNASSLYKKLYDNNDPELILVFDDCNDIMTNKGAVEILRVAVDITPTRRITYAGMLNRKGDKKIYPDSFLFQSKVIIISNIPLRKIDKAIASRTSPIEVWVTKEEMLEYIGIHLASAPPVAIKLEWKQKIFDFLTKELPLTEINRIDFRVFQDACLWYAANIGTPGMNHKSDQWKKFVYTLVH